MGTPHYMAPEQLEHPKDVDHRADIYSLGVVFYQMLTGELPIGKFAPPSKKVEIDVRLDEVVLRALEKEPERRYQQVSQLKTRVETITQTPYERATGSASALPPDDVQHPDTSPSKHWRSQWHTPVLASGHRRERRGRCFSSWPSVLCSPSMSVSRLNFIRALEPPPVPPLQEVLYAIGGLLAFVVFVSGITAPFGATILGAVSISQIRHSAGRLYGLGLALFDALLFPLLLLDWVIVMLPAAVIWLFLNTKSCQRRPAHAAHRLDQVRRSRLLRFRDPAGAWHRLPDRPLGVARGQPAGWCTSPRACHWLCHVSSATGSASALPPDVLQHPGTSPPSTGGASGTRGTPGPDAWSRHAGKFTARPSVCSSPESLT